jgi:hypothetical protein
MGVSNLSSISSTTFITALDTVYYNSSVSLQTGEGNWIQITLQKPFYINGSSGFIIEVSHQGTSPTFSIMQANMAGRSIYGNSNNPTGILQDRLGAVKLSIINSLDLALLGFLNMNNIMCSGNFPVTVQLKNNSPVEITSAKIDWSVNSNPQGTFQWNGNLPPGVTINATIGALTLNAGMSYTFMANVYNPNNGNDRIEYNDSISFSSTFTVQGSVCEIGNDTIIAASSSIVIDAGAGYSSYLWSTGETTQTIVVDSSGVGIGTTSIWVKVTNINNCFASDTINITFIDDTGIEDLQDNASFSIVANPSNGNFQIYMNSFPAGKIQICIYGLNGQLLVGKEQFISASNQIFYIDAEFLPSGMYLLKITGDKNSFVRKLIIER